jgi:hypothetical protein
MNVNEFTAHIWMIRWQLSKLAHVRDRLFILANAHKPARRFETEQAQNQDNAGKNDVQYRCIKPLLGSVVGDVERSSPISKISQHDSQVDCTTEYADAKTTDAAGSNLS